MGDVSIAVVGGGINGAGIAWELVRKGYRVTLFEKDAFGSATSSATTKMIHGGLRYLEQLDFGLVRESLRERAWLVRHAPDLVRPIELVVPIYSSDPRPRWFVHVGLVLYDILAGRDGMSPHRSLTADEVLKRGPSLKKDGLRGGFAFTDCQVHDDRLLVETVMASAVAEGLDAREFTAVTAARRTENGWVLETGGEHEQFDLLVLAAGPWMESFLRQNGIDTDARLTLVRGSHLLLDRTISSSGFLLQSPGERRVFFVLPWEGGTLVGTTEVVQETMRNSVEASDEEIEYLLELFNAYFTPAATRAQIRIAFAGVRPLIGTARDPGAISREYRIEVEPGIVKVFGGKMTTFMSLAREVGRRVDGLTGSRRPARVARLRPVVQGDGDALRTG